MRWPHWRCGGYAVLGLLGGCSVAYAQDPGLVDVLASAHDPTLGQLAMALVTGGGWPGALAFLGWLIGRGSFKVPVAIEIVHRHVDDKPPGA